jgi:hypothetical protein
MLKRPFSLRQLMLRLTMDRLLADHVRAPVRPADPPNVGALAPGAPTRNLGVTAPTAGAATMAQANPRWGAPRIHGEPLKLGIDVCQATVAKYMGRRCQPPSQTWRTFLRNHVGQIVAADFFVVPTVTYRLLFVLVAPRPRSATHPAHRGHCPSDGGADGPTTTRGVSVERRASLLAARSRSRVRLRRGHGESRGDGGSPYGTARTVATCIRRANIPQFVYSCIAD